MLAAALPCRRTTRKGHILNKKPIVGVLVKCWASAWVELCQQSICGRNLKDWCFLGEYSLIFPNELFGNHQELDTNIVECSNLFKVAKHFSRLVEPDDSLFIRCKLRQARRVDIANIVWSAAIIVIRFKLICNVDRNFLLNLLSLRVEALLRKWAWIQPQRKTRALAGT